MWRSWRNFNVGFLDWVNFCWRLGDGDIFPIWRPIRIETIVVSLIGITFERAVMKGNTWIDCTWNWFYLSYDCIMSKCYVFNRCFGLCCCIVPQGCILLTGRLNPTGRHFVVVVASGRWCHRTLGNLWHSSEGFKSGFYCAGFAPDTFYTGQEGYFVTISYHWLKSIHAYIPETGHRKQQIKPVTSVLWFHNES